MPSTRGTSGTVSKRASCATAAQRRFRHRPRFDLLADGSDVGDPVTVQVAVDYSLPFIGSTIALRGSATMRLEQRADYAGSGVDVSTTRESSISPRARGRRHRRVRSDGDARRPALPGADGRHRQLVGPQAAPAAASRRSGLGRRCAVRRVLYRFGSREHGDPERSDAVRRGRWLQLQRPGRRREQGRVTLLYQSKTYAAGSVGGDDTETQPPCDTPSLMFDVKGAKQACRSSFRFPGCPRSRRSTRTHASS